MTSTHQMLDGLHEEPLYRRLDPHRMMDLVRSFPRQCREAVAIAGKFAPNARRSPGEIANVVITGLGGSAIGGDFARCLAEEYGNAPVSVNRDYTLPHFVGPKTLVIAASYSGNTEETLSAYDCARRAGAQLMAVTSGGRLADLAAADGADIAVVPGGQPPRSATGYMFFPLLAYLAYRGLLDHNLAPDIEETLTGLDSAAVRFAPSVPTCDNQAKQLALAIYGKLPVIYGSQGYRGAVAVRWKGQFNENAKQAAFANVFPEQNHNEILAWTLAGRQKPNWAVIFLRDHREVSDTPRIARRVEVTKEIIGDVPWHEVWSEGRSLLARMFSLVTFADYLTVYLAYLNAVCPTDIAGIDRLKAELAKV